MQTKISIVIPVLNEEDYVGLLLQNLAEQTFKDFEVYVIDGGSTDATEKVVNSYKSKLDLNFVKSPQKGVALQRNYGASLAKHDWVIFFDADVAIERDFLEKIVQSIEKHPKVDFLSTWIRPLSSEKFFNVAFDVYNHAAYAAQKFIPTAVGAFMCVKKRAFFAVNGFDADLKVAEDFDLVLRLHKKKFNCVLLKDPFVSFSMRRVETLGQRRYIISMSKNIVYFPLRAVLKNASWVDYPMEGGSFYKKLSKRIDKGRKQKA